MRSTVPGKVWREHTKRGGPIVAVLLALAAPAAAQPVIANYDRCMEIVQRDPDRGFDEAIRWADFGGGLAADHCAAVALGQLGLYDEAARRLEKIAVALTEAPIWERAEVLGQAANAWWLAGDALRAAELLETALGVAPGVASLWVDRARLRAEAGATLEAIADLDQAIALNPRNASARAFRANALRSVGRLAEAEDDAEWATELDPNLPEGWLELGNVYDERGEPDRARQMWIQVRLLDEDGPAGEAALRNLERIDLGRLEGDPEGTVETAPSDVAPVIAPRRIDGEAVAPPAQ